eukprot:CAMPEP_0115087510 /NCGR_PEP_ID=MMETSP0227-20121206/23346_1 /TAXON_ID=89957 /ORGANISM="Polarella glacialis, Strain CCMP 1383" /LENGTH=604 /DNA_ID=CAMNT_0002477417 /DNA_START=83 /DNA_END=1898 /DNA_ORIENTATION=-
MWKSIGGTPVVALFGLLSLCQSSSGCSRNKDCGTNPWCDDASYDAYCAANGERGNCPQPQCVPDVVAISPTTTRASATTILPSATTTTTLNSQVAKSGNPLGGAAVLLQAPDLLVPRMKSAEGAWPCNTAGLCTCERGASTSMMPSGTSASPTTLPLTSSAASPTTANVETSTTTASVVTTVISTTSAGSPTTRAAGPTLPPSDDATINAAVAALQSADSAGVFMYDTGNGWIESDIYKWADMIKAVQLMAVSGVGKAKLWLGEGNNHIYGLVNVAAFLAQAMQETIQYNACDENNWSDKNLVAEAGGSTYSATAACGQLHQSYQHYTCSKEEDELAAGSMACEVDPEMEMRASTQAKWYGAPAKLFCAPTSKLPKAPRWDSAGPWCAPEGGWGHVAPFPDTVDLKTYFDYVRAGGSCKDYTGIKAGGWTFIGEGCKDGSCPGAPAELFGVPEGRTDVEGCCWWGRGVIQTTGTCNFGKLNYYMGKRAAREGRVAMYPEIDFCRNPGAICDADSPQELKWVAGFFYWLNAVQPYSSGGWTYLEELKAWVDGGMRLTDTSFIDGASGIVNRGCHNPPNCGTGELHAGAQRADNFKEVLHAMGLTS